MSEVDIDVCRECKEHAEFEREEEDGECLSNCCGAPAYQPDEYECDYE